MVRSKPSDVFYVWSDPVEILPMKVSPSRGVPITNHPQMDRSRLGVVGSAGVAAEQADAGGANTGARHTSWRAGHLAYGIRLRGDAGHALRQEPLPVHPLRNTFTVQVRSDAAQVEGPPRTRDQAEVDVLCLGDDTLVEHEPDLLGDG